MKKLIDKLQTENMLTKEEFKALLVTKNDTNKAYLAEKARETAKLYFGNNVYIRGLIEFTNFCKNDCFYCGIRCSNKNASRYRLTKEAILDCCKTGYTLGFRTFVLQGGDDPFFTDDKMIDIISSIRNKYLDCAITLSIGEKSYESYKAFYDAGANRYLLRHETANSTHYSKLHPETMQLSTRKQSLQDLKSIGFQVGCGFMVGSPFQTIDNIIEDLFFIKDLNPQMVGIGPFIPHKDTPFKSETIGSTSLTLMLLSIVRLMLRNVLLPSTTALGTANTNGREQGILAGANVVMPNLSPCNVREKYLLYDNKICTGDEAAESKAHLTQSMGKIGYEIITARGDFKCL